jgi:hypothetical protein
MIQVVGVKIGLNCVKPAWMIQPGLLMIQNLMWLLMPQQVHSKIIHLLTPASRNLLGPSALDQVNTCVKPPRGYS